MEREGWLEVWLWKGKASLRNIKSNEWLHDRSMGHRFPREMPNVGTRGAMRPSADSAALDLLLQPAVSRSRKTKWLSAR